MLVRATAMSSKLGVSIKELHRVAYEGEEFEVTPTRFRILTKENRFKAVFVQEVRQVDDVYERADTIPFEVEADEEDVQDEVASEEVVVKIPEVEDEATLEEPLVEAPAVVVEDEPKPKKKRKSRKKTAEEVVE